MGSPLDIVSNASAKMANPPHRYYPLGVEIAGYVVNDMSVPLMLFIFFAGLAVIFFGTQSVVKRVHPQLPRGELLTIMWFVLSGSIHLFFEGYYAMNMADLGSKTTLFGQLWKEYALSDSRYLTQNAFVLCMESITAAFWGPGCFIIAAMIMTEHPLRHPLQIIVSHGQFYGVVLYYATSMFDHYLLGIAYSRPEAYYFWFYYFLTNFFWAVIPALLIYNSCVACAQAFKVSAGKKTGKKIN